MAISINFNLRSSKSEETTIMLLCRCGEQRVKVSSRQSINTATWDKIKQRCYTSKEKFSENINAHSIEVNSILDDMILKIHNKLIEIGATEKTPLYRIKSILTESINEVYGIVDEENMKKIISPLQFFAHHIESKRIDNHTGRYISERTKIHHRTVLKRLTSFFHDSHLIDDWSIFKSNTFGERYTLWCYNKKKYKQNTVYATFGVLKSWLNAAKQEGFDVGEIYHKLKGKGEDVDAIYFTEDEIQRMYNLDIPSLIKEGFVDFKSTMENTRDLFVIGCWTGLRRSDLSRLNDAVFDLDKNTITITAEKTKRKVIIPMHPFVSELYKKYSGVFPVLAVKSKANGHIKEIARLAGIDEIVPIVENRAGVVTTTKYRKYQLAGMHTARRSFATNMFKRGFPTISIMQLTGHTTEANFMKYIKVTLEENAAIMNQRFKSIFCQFEK